MSLGAGMKVIEANETISVACSCGVTLQANADDIDENLHDGGYGFCCPRCGRYHDVAFKSLPESIQRILARREIGH